MKTCRLLGSVCLFLLLTSNLPAQAPADIRQGLVAYWPMEGTDGVTTPDATPNANHLSPVGLGAGNFVPGQRGNSVSLSGTTMYLTNIHAADNTTSGLPIYRAGSYSVLMWIKGSPQTGKYIFTEGNTNSTNPLFILQTGQTAANNSKFDVIIRNDAAGTSGTLLNHVISSNVVFDNTWHHIAWIDNNGRATLYVDGNPDPANFNYTRSGSFTFHSTVLGSLVRTTVSTAVFNGQIDEVAAWERPLSQVEIQQVMVNGLETPIPPLSPMILSQTSNAVRNLGDHAKFTVAAAGFRPITYQWLKNGEPIQDATSPTLALYHLTEADTGSYSVQITNPGGTVTVTNIALTVLPDPVPDVQRGLVSYWPMELFPIDDQSRYFTQDLYSQNGLVLMNMDTGGVYPGMFGYALAFDGVTQYAMRNGGFPASQSPAYSIALWINAGAAGLSEQRFFAESSTNNNGALFGFGGTTNRNLRVTIRDDAGASILDLTSTRTALDQNWHHIVWTETNGLARLYIDGVLDETDFTYTRRSLTLDQTAIGAILRTSPTNFASCIIDDLAVWDRVLSLTEIQDVFAGLIPVPNAAIAPKISLQPEGKSVMTRSKVQFTFTATGTSPLTIQWRKDGTNLLDATNAVLNLNGVQMNDAGNYTVVVTNMAGSVTSMVATLTVTLRPPAPSEFKLDFNNTGAEGTMNTDSGFESFALDTSGPGPFKKTYGGIEVTLSGVGVNLATRARTTPSNSVDFSEEKLLQDFVFAADTTAGQGMDVAVDFLEPNQPYQVTLWSFDAVSVTVNRISDWSANGVQVKTGYSFFGSDLPTSNDRYRFSFPVQTDAAGSILIQGRRNSAASGANHVFLNALSIKRRDIRIQRIEILPTQTVRLMIEVLDPAAPIRVEGKTGLNDPNWVEVDNVFFGDPTGNVIEATFLLPESPKSFYRVVSP